jgi:hypothetical protein
MRNLLIFFSLALFCSPLLAGRDVSAIRYARSDLPAGTPAVASNGSRFLMLWPMAGHIFGSLSDSTGGSNSPAFVVVPFASTSSVQVIGTASGYVAIWNERDSVPIFGRLTSDGILERRVALARPRFAGARLAFNGSQIAIIDTTGSTIDIEFYDLDGTLLHHSPVTAYSGESYAVTPTGPDFAVVTAGATGINEFRVANNGAVQPAVRIQPPVDPLTTRYMATVTARSGRVLIAWIESPLGHSFGSTLASATIQPDGTVTQTSSAQGPAGAAGLVLLPLDHGYVLALTVSAFVFAKPELFALRVDDTGKLLDDHPLLLGDGQTSGSASLGNTIKFAFVPFASPVGLVTLTATVDAAGITASPAIPITTPVRQFAPVVAGNGGGFTAAWMEQESGAKRIVAARVNAAGEPLDATGIVFDPHAASPPVIAHGPAAELIVWLGAGHLLATRLSPFGGVLDATPIDIAPMSFGSYDVVWNGSRFFVVWTDGTKFFGAFVGADGVATSARDLGVQTATFDSASVTALDVAWDGRQYIVAYAEAPFLACGCITFPDRVRIMRISAAGTAIDVPLRVPGVHFRGHVASSGAESLLVLDDGRVTSSIVVRGDGEALHLDPEVRLFEWFYGSNSDVAWDGSSYVAAVRYTGPPTDAGWLAAIQVNQFGIPMRSLVIQAAGPPDFTYEASPSIAADLAAGTAFVISELAPPAWVARARLYFLSEFLPMPAPPPAPRNAVSYFGGTTARIDWQSDGGGNGFLIEQSVDFGKRWFPVATVPADARMVTVNAKIGDKFRVRAFGPGGLSDGPITSVGSMFRHRAERH